MGSLKSTDPEMYDLLEKQKDYERSTLKMIASENFVSDAVLEVTGSILTNKYAEGYPGNRYYEGNGIVDEIENLAIYRLKKLFKAEHANVQPYSGSPANNAVYRATIELGDRVLGMPVTEGGHLTHGWPVNFSGSDYTRIPYGVNLSTEVIDYDQVRDIALRERPKLIWIGGTAYPRIWNYEAVASIAQEVKAYLVADIAHISGLILAGVHPSPVEYSDIVSSTSHKTLRGPRGGFILSKIEDRYQDLYHKDSKYNLAKRIDRAVFPSLQGGPHMNQIGALTVTLKEASSDSFVEYGKQIVRNSRKLAEHLIESGIQLVSSGTDNHMIIMNFKSSPYSGKQVAKALAIAGIICNFNQVPGDQRSPMVTSGVRIGVAALTSMGMKENEMVEIASLIKRVLDNVSNHSQLRHIGKDVEKLARAFVPPGYTNQ